MNHSKLLFIGEPAEREYLYHLKEMMGSASCAVKLSPVVTITQVEHECKSKGITGVISTSVPLLSKLLNLEGERKHPSLDSYAGSLIERNGIEYVFSNSLEQFHTVSYSKFLTRRYISKLVRADSWYRGTSFSWSLLEPGNVETVFEEFQKAILIGIDIETVKSPPRIKCISYTALFISPEGKLETKSVVLPLDSQFAVTWMRKFNWELQAPKVFQNGKYDNAYFFAYSAPVYNYIFDTANAMHCWYSELPKDLGFLNAFFIRDAFFFKDLAQTSDLHTYYKYNALDSWATVNAFVAWLLEAPSWAKKNYLMEFPLVFPCHMAEMRGVAVDKERLIEQNAVFTKKLELSRAVLERTTGIKGFNANSHVQVKKLMTALGCKDIAEKSSDEKSIKKAAYRHPLNARVLNTILDIRGYRKLISTYLPVGEGLEQDYKGRMLFSLNPHGTDSARLASREHAFWCGVNVQQVPRGDDVKRIYVADPEFLFAEIDEKTAETYDTAYIAGETNLISAVTSDKDFHSLNCSAFFGKKYEDIWDSIKGKSKNKVLRDLSKRVNHGANYLMGAGVLLDTMGIEAVEFSRKELGLPKAWTLLDICEHLLRCFHKTYPGLEACYYPGVVSQIVKTAMLTSPQGWTRYCFGKPDKNKRDKNSYVAHVAQNCNAIRLNMAYMKVFYEIALDEKFRNNFKLLPQIHDSIWFMFRIGHEYICQEVAERMKIPVTVKSYAGIDYTYTVPVDIKAGAKGTGVKYWNETE